MKGYKSTPTTYAIGLIEAIEDEEIKSKALKNFNETWAINCENAYGGAASISRALYYAFDWDTTPEGGDYWNKIYEDYKSKRL